MFCDFFPFYKPETLKTLLFISQKLQIPDMEFSGEEED